MIKLVDLFESKNKLSSDEQIKSKEDLNKL